MSSQSSPHDLAERLKGGPDGDQAPGGVDDKGTGTGCVAPSRFCPAWWLPSPHLQTIWPTLGRRRPEIALERERVELPDGDFIDLDWAGADARSLVMVLHGLEGSSESSYVRGILAAASQRGWATVAMHFRGCSGEPNRLPRTYHSGETSDLQQILDHIRTTRSIARVALVGYSLGGNVLLKWLGERSRQANIDAAVAVSVPFDLARAAARLEHGFPRMYQAWLLSDLRRKLVTKFDRDSAPIDLSALCEWRTMREFDDAVTAPLHGFEGADEYYRQSSSRAFLGRIAVPTLLLQARDDPFMTPSVIPTAAELSSTTRLELSRHGGHVGFIAGANPLHPIYWLERRIPAFLSEFL